MSDPTSSPARVRPSTVTISSYLLYLVAAVQVVSLILGLAYLGTMSDAATEAYGSAEGATTNTISTVIASVVGLLLAVALVVLAVLNNRGRNAARITTWVLGGILLCCTGVGFGANALLSSVDTAAPGQPSPAEVQRRMEEALPSWYGPLTTTLSVISMIALLVALILLALPASNAYFRRPATPGWEPPVPGAPYPGQPYPGQPQSGQPYPGQPYQGQPQPGPGGPQPGQGYSGYPQAGPSDQDRPPAGPTPPAPPAG